MESPRARVDSHSIKNGKLGIRHFQCFLYFVSMVVAYASEMSIRFTFVHMSLEWKSENLFNLDNLGVIWLSLLCSYIVMQIPLSYLVTIWNAKIILAIAILIRGVGHLLCPIVFHRFGLIYLCPYSVLCGLTEACCLPCLYTLLSKWVPPNERGRLGPITYTGTHFGLYISSLICNELLTTGGGWRSMCYVFGSVSVIWPLIFLFLGSDSSAASVRSTASSIGKADKRYIESSLREGEEETPGSDRKTLRIPWKEIFMSQPFWGLLIAHCANQWSSMIINWWVIVFIIRTREVNPYEPLLHIIRLIILLLLTFTVGWLSDVRVEKAVSRGLARKICNTISHWGFGVVLICMIFISKNDKRILFTIAEVILIGLDIVSICGFQINHMDLSTNFAGVLIALTSTAARVVETVASLILYYIVPDMVEQKSWRSILIITMPICFVGNLFFMLLGRGETQW